MSFATPGGNLEKTVKRRAVHGKSGGLASMS